jgi:hypothetical protein
MSIKAATVKLRTIKTVDNSPLRLAGHCIWQKSYGAFLEMETFSIRQTLGRLAVDGFGTTPLPQPERE